MKAAFIDRPGPAESIRYGDLAKPRPAGGEVLVRVKAAAVNPVDTYVRAGMYPMKLPSPFIVGCDLAGVVEGVGPDATRFAKGDRVWGSNQGLMGRQGTFAEYAAVDENWLYPTPDGVADQDAAAVALVGITAHLGLFREGRLKMGERVFVGGGTGGVGSCVVQMAHAVGARVLASAGSPEKVEVCRQLGANMALNYKTDDLDTVIGRFGAIDVWFETRRDQDLELAVRHLAMRGRIILMAGHEARPAFPLRDFFVKDCRLLGFAMFNAPASEQRKCAAEINRWLAKGKLRPQIARVMKLSETAEAHKLQEDNTIHGVGTLAGKIVVVP
ncbi:MAG: NADPH:quinone reductase [Planctomycetaceae bacterium]|nr:NADPH:quinone reductase [Planctomycetaceae bacterium]